MYKITFDRHTQVSVDKDALTIRFGNMKKTVVRRQGVSLIHMDKVDESVIMFFEQGVIELHDISQWDMETIEEWSQHISKEAQA